MDIRFWGVRGSYPVPGPATVRYGGQTSCVEVRSSAGGCLIVDAGTGLRALGSLTGGAPFRGHILLTHLHWDHVGWNTRLDNGSWVPTFPNARYVMARREFEHWQDQRHFGDE